MQSSSPIADRATVRRFLALAALFSATAFAYPDASPWGSANPAADETCSSCHYDYDPVRDSAAVEIIGLPETASPGNAYEIGVRIASVEAAVSASNNAQSPFGDTIHYRRFVVPVATP